LAVELDNVVALELLVTIDELEVGVGFGEAKLYYFFVLEEGKFF